MMLWAMKKYVNVIEIIFKAAEIEVNGRKIVMFR